MMIVLMVMIVDDSVDMMIAVVVANNSNLVVIVVEDAVRLPRLEPQSLISKIVIDVKNNQTDDLIPKSPLQALKLKLMICCEYYLEVDTAVVYNAVCIDVHYVENVNP